jgi:hypothetical protein
VDGSLAIFLKPPPASWAAERAYFLNGWVVINGLVASSFFAFFKVFLAMVCVSSGQDASVAEARSVICKPRAKVHRNPRRRDFRAFAPLPAIPFLGPSPPPRRYC